MIGPDSLSVEVVSLDVGGDLRLPFVPVVEELLLVVEELLVGLGGELEVGPLDDGVDGARLLAEPAVDALGHVDVVPGRSPGAVRALLRLDGDSLSWAHGLTQLAGDATLLAGGVPEKASQIVPFSERKLNTILAFLKKLHGF